MIEPQELPQILQIKANSRATRVVSDVANWTQLAQLFIISTLAFLKKSKCFYQIEDLSSDYKVRQCHKRYAINLDEQLCYKGIIKIDLIIFWTAQKITTK